VRQSRHALPLNLSPLSATSGRFIAAAALAWPVTGREHRVHPMAVKNDPRANIGLCLELSDDAPAYSSAYLRNARIACKLFSLLIGEWDREAPGYVV
jgi:hypothetical protein